jgi:hypothetical protein
VLIDDLASIRMRYLRGFFFVDLLGVIPWHFADCALPVCSQEFDGETCGSSLRACLRLPVSLLAHRQAQASSNTRHACAREAK